MPLLQDPIKALDQIEWYLSNRQAEKFPGAFLLAAGNLVRQVLEQILFILAFYSGLPKHKFLRRNNELQTAGKILQALRQTDSKSCLTYFELARNRGPRIRKFARYPRSLERFRRIMNEPSHFSNPAANRKIKERDIHEFLGTVRGIFDGLDVHLITAAVNELRSDGWLRAALGNDDLNTPAIQYDIVVTPRNLIKENGKLVLKGPEFPIQIVPSTHEIPNRWTKRIVLVQHSAGIALLFRHVTKWGSPVNISSGKAILETFARNEKARRQLLRRLRQLGYEVSVTIESENELKHRE